MSSDSAQGPNQSGTADNDAVDRDRPDNETPPEHTLDPNATGDCSSDSSSHGSYSTPPQLHPSMVPSKEYRKNHEIFYYSAVGLTKRLVRANSLVARAKKRLTAICELRNLDLFEHDYLLKPHHIGRWDIAFAPRILRNGSWAMMVRRWHPKGRYCYTLAFSNGDEGSNDKIMKILEEYKSKGQLVSRPEAKGVKKRILFRILNDALWAAAAKEDAKADSGPN